MAKKSQESKVKKAKSQKPDSSIKKEAQVKETPEEKKPVKKTLAKAGKRSQKAIAEEEAKAAKEARKVEVVAEPEAKPAPKKQTPRVKKYSKNQKAARQLIEQGKLYSIEEAAELLPKISKVKFDATVELHVRLGIDPRQSDQQFRTSVILPSGSGKSYRVAVLADEKKSAVAKKAGADVVGAEDILAGLAKGKFDFDVLVAAPDQMAALGKHAKLLGPKGLMPSPKSGTVTAEPEVAVEEIKKGRLELKNDAGGIVHAGVGKISFKKDALIANIKAALASISQNKPAGIKGTYIKSIYLTASMSPSITLDVTKAIAGSRK